MPDSVSTTRAMRIGHPVGHTGQMDDGGARTQRVVVAVSPQLLADAVRRALAASGIETVDVSERSGRRADVAVVSAGREGDVDAVRVLTLSGDGDAGAAPGRVVDLASLRTALTPRSPGS